MDACSSYLVVLQEAADGPLRGAERGVQKVAISLRSVAGLFDAAAHLHGTGLVIRAVGGGDELTVDAEGGEPSLQVVLFDGGVV